MMAIKQITKAVAAIQDTQHSPSSNMDTDSEHTTNTTSNATTNLPSHQLNLPAIISELKNKIATISNETSALLLQYLPPKSTTNTTPSSAT